MSMGFLTHSTRIVAAVAVVCLTAGVVACLLAVTPDQAGAASLQQLQSEARRTRTQMKQLTAEQRVIAAKWVAARERLDTVNAELVAARQDLTRARAQLDRQRELVAGRMVTMYKAGQYTWLDVVTSASNLSDTETVMDFLRRISMQDRREETEMQALARTARELEADVESERKHAVAAQIDLDDQRAALDAKVAERSVVLKGLVARIKKILSAPLLLMKSGGDVTQITWAQALLKDLGMPMTADNVAAVVAWEMAEGGHWYNTAYYNPLNTTQPMPGATVFNSVGVKAYTSWAQGLRATVITLRNGFYGGILAALRRGDDAQAVADAVAASPWGTGTFTPRR